MSEHLNVEGVVVPVSEHLNVEGVAVPVSEHLNVRAWVLPMSHSCPLSLRPGLAFLCAHKPQPLGDSLTWTLQPLSTHSHRPRTAVMGSPLKP